MSSISRPPRSTPHVRADRACARRNIAASPPSSVQASPPRRPDTAGNFSRLWRLRCLLSGAGRYDALMTCNAWTGRRCARRRAGRRLDAVSGDRDGMVLGWRPRPRDDGPRRAVQAGMAAEVPRAAWTLGSARLRARDADGGAARRRPARCCCCRGCSIRIASNFVLRRYLDTLGYRATAGGSAAISRAHDRAGWRAAARAHRRDLPTSRRAGDADRRQPGRRSWRGSRRSAGPIWCAK